MFSRQQAVEFLVKRGYHITKTRTGYQIESSSINVDTGKPDTDLTVDGSGLDDFAVNICRSENGSAD